MFGKLNLKIILSRYFYSLINIHFNFSVFHGRMHWQQLKVFKDHTSMATGIQFGKDSQFIASSSVDGTLNLYGI